jgi:O-antigen ligase
LALGFSSFQIDGAERAMVLLAIYTGLFLAGYWVARWERTGSTLLKVVVALSTWQALLAFYEWQAGTDLVASWGIWSMIGLGTDSVARGGNLRASGLFRPSATTAHPIVLSGLIATAIAVAAILYLRETSPKSRRRMLMAMAPLAVGLLVVNARTGFVVMVVVTLAIVASQLRRLPRFLPLAVAAMMAFTVGGILSPDAVRSSLNLFWNASEDNSVNVRVERLADLPDLISQEPVLGSGWLTNDPKVYLFDNAYTHALLELGIVGTALLLLFLGLRQASPGRASRGSRQRA